MYIQAFVYFVQKYFRVGHSIYFARCSFFTLAARAKWALIKPLSLPSCQFQSPRYAQLLSAFRPCVDLVLSGHTARDATDATRRIFRTLQVPEMFPTGRWWFTFHVSITSPHITWSYPRFWDCYAEKGGVKVLCHAYLQQLGGQRAQWIHSSSTAACCGPLAAWIEVETGHSTRFV